MKTLLLFAFAFLSIVNLKAQNIYLPGKIVKGKTASYYCKGDSVYLRVRNVNNVDTLLILYYMDGTTVPEEEELDGTYGHTQKDLFCVLREALTDEEWEKIKGKSGGLSLYITADSVGNTKELEFGFWVKDPVIPKFSPDRLYQLELKFKEIIKFIYRLPSKRFRNAKYLAHITYRELKL